MAYYSFAADIIAGRPITLYEGGRLRRDFTYIDDIVSGVLACLERAPPGRVPRVFNIGNNRSEAVSTLVELLERSLGRRAVIEMVPRPISDVEATWADLELIEREAGYAATTRLEEGIPRFAAWFLDYHAVRAQKDAEGC